MNAPNELTLAGAADHWLATYSSPATLRSYRNVLNRFLRENGPARPLSQVTPDDVQAWVNRLKDQSELFADHPTRPVVKKKPSPATVANRVRCLKAFFNWCVARDFIPESPARFVSAKRYQQNRHPKAIPTSVLLAMFRHLATKPPFARLRDGAILTLLASYGLRVGDCASLRLPMVDFESERLAFIVKGGRELLLPMPHEVATVLRAWLEQRARLRPDPDHDHVFVTNRTRPPQRYQPLTRAGMTQIVLRLSGEVGGKRYGPHAIRHWRGQSLADARVAPTIVQALLGHEDITTTLAFYYNQDYPRLSRAVAQHAVTPDHHPPLAGQGGLIPFPSRLAGG